MNVPEHKHVAMTVLIARVAPVGWCVHPPLVTVDHRQHVLVQLNLFVATLQICELQPSADNCLSEVSTVPTKMCEAVLVAGSIATALFRLLVRLEVGVNIQENKLHLIKSRVNINKFVLRQKHQ